MRIEVSLGGEAGIDIQGADDRVTGSKEFQRHDMFEILSHQHSEYLTARDERQECLKWWL